MGSASNSKYAKMVEHMEGMEGVEMVAAVELNNASSDAAVIGFVGGDLLI